MKILNIYFNTYLNLLFTGCFLSTNINSGGSVGMSVGEIFLKKKPCQKISRQGF